MSFAEYEDYDALGLARLIKDKKITVLEAMDEAIARAERLNPKLNAIVYKDYDRARDSAKSPALSGLFAGVPMLLKDMRGDAQGMPTRGGSRYVPATPGDHDCELVARYKRAGLIPFGKTNVPEFGIIPTTESKLYGPARNPWDSTRSPGGSSGGSAVAVAAGIAPIAHATDGGGSIRIPASCCGLVGLKVSRGRITQGPDMADSTCGLSVDHVVTRSVRDCAAALDISCTPDFGDPYFAPAPEGSYLEGIREKPKRLRIGVATKGMHGRPFDSEVLEAVTKSAALCESLGHTVEEASPPFDAQAMTNAFLTLWATSVAQGIEAVARMTGVPPSRDLVEGLTWGLYLSGRDIIAARQMDARQFLYGMARTAVKFHETYDLWLTPTLSMPPMKLGVIDLDETNVYKAFAPLMGYVPYTASQNGTGQPAINLPLHWSRDGLPLGVQFVARMGGEMLLLRFAAELEEAQPWARRRPNPAGA